MSNIIRRVFPQFPKAQLAPNPANARGPALGGAPVAFSAQAEALAPGANIVLNAQTLQSGFRAAYYIDEIRVSAITSVFPTATPPFRFHGLAGLIGIKFQTGKYAFSRDSIPFGLYGPYCSRVDYGENYAGQSGIAQGRRSFSMVRWALPKPLLMPPGDVVQASIAVENNAALIGAGITVDVDVTYIGRLVAPGYEGKTRFVPWASYMQMEIDENDVPGRSFQTSSREFENPFMKSLYVQRFTARTFWQTGQQGVLSNFAVYEMSSQGQLSTTVIPFFETRIDDSMGYQIAPQFLPVGDVFDTSRHAWTFGRALAARQQFNVQLRTGLDGAAPDPATDSVWRQQVGFVGYREEAY